jgi:hypothetical protein
LDLKIELDGDEIVVSRERVFSWSYRKSVDEPRLVMTRSSMGRASPSAMHAFRAAAF